MTHDADQSARRFWAYSWARQLALEVYPEYLHLACSLYTAASLSKLPSPCTWCSSLKCSSSSRAMPAWSACCLNMSNLVELCQGKILPNAVQQDQPRCSEYILLCFEAHPDQATAGQVAGCDCAGPQRASARLQDAPLGTLSLSSAWPEPISLLRGSCTSVAPLQNPV